MCSLLLAVPAVADIYRWVDAGGRVHYGDRPTGQPAAAAVTLPPANSYTHTSISDLLAGQIEASSGPNPAVVMYSAPWCGVCKRARAWLQGQGIAFAERNIEADPWARQRWEKLGGRGVPLLTVGGKAMHGFDAGSFSAVYRSQQQP